MNAIFSAFAPSAATQIRMDHAHVLTTAHHYAGDLPPSAKRALFNAIAIALEIHAQLEEELFYPAVAIVEPGKVGNNVPEHDAMRELIATLRGMSASHPDYDGTFHTLMRTVMRHVADEETLLLPEAERSLGRELDRIGAEMAMRRMQLVTARGGEIAAATLYLLPSSLLLGGAGAMLAGMHAVRYAMRRFGA